MVLCAIAKSVGGVGDDRHVILIGVGGVIVGGVIPEPALGGITVSHDRGGQAVARIVFGSDGLAAPEGVMVQAKLMARLVGAAFADVMRIVGQVDGEDKGDIGQISSGKPVVVGD